MLDLQLLPAAYRSSLYGKQLHMPLSTRVVSIIVTAIVADIVELVVVVLADVSPQWYRLACVTDYRRRRHAARLHSAKVGITGLTFW